MAALMQWDEIVKSTAVAYVNHGLTLLAGYVATKFKFQSDVLSPENLLVLAGAIVAGAASLAMRLYRQKAVHNLVESARHAEPGTPFRVIKEAADDLPILGE